MPSEHQSSLKLLQYREAFVGSIAISARAINRSDSSVLLHGDLLAISRSIWVLRALVDGEDCYLRWSHKDRLSTLVEVAKTMVGIPMVQAVSEPNAWELWVGRSRC